MVDSAETAASAASTGSTATLPVILSAPLPIPDPSAAASEFEWVFLLLANRRIICRVCDCMMIAALSRRLRST